LFSAVQHIFAGIADDVVARLGLLGDQSAGVLTALRGVQQREGGPHRRSDQEPCRGDPVVIAGHIFHSPKNKLTLIVSRYPGIMADRSEYVVVFRSADPSAKADAIAAAEQLAEEGVDAVVLGDDEPGVVEGTWEVRAPLSEQARAEAILAAPP